MLGIDNVKNTFGLHGADAFKLKPITLVGPMGNPFEIHGQIFA
jgi:hypothetical protein